ncbi:MAG: hypothetical protein ABSB50_20410, partial [Terracidiphilus sp.]
MRPAKLAVDVAPPPSGSAQLVRLGVQKCVQRLLDRRPYHLVQVLADAPLVDLYHRPQRRSCLTGRFYSRFHGWLHRPCLRGLAPPACTNPQA